MLALLWYISSLPSRRSQVLLGVVAVGWRQYRAHDFEVAGLKNPTFEVAVVEWVNLHT
jgi:hypothetical protein